MTWFKIDDSMWSHPKVMLCSDAAIALWARAGSFSCDKLTDGFIHRAYLPSLRSTEKAAAELAAAGLWDEVADGWRFHDWEDFNETGEDVVAKREAARLRMQRVRANKKRTTPASSPSVRANEPRTEGETEAQFAERSRVVPGVPSPVKTRLLQSSPVGDREAREQDRTDEPESIEDLCIRQAAGLGVDFMKVRLQLARATDRVPHPTAVMRIIAAVLERAKPPVKSPTGVVIAAVKNDWPEWQQLLDEDEAGAA